jgi:hypothetical protein
MLRHKPNHNHHLEDFLRLDRDVPDYHRTRTSLPLADLEGEAPYRLFFLLIEQLQRKKYVLA